MNFIKEITKLNAQIDELAKKISQYNIISLEVSKSNVGWHIEHILLTINAIIEAVKESNPEKYKSSFNFVRILVFNTKTIPRGRAKSPKVVAPKIYDEITLKEHLEFTKSKIQELEKMGSGKYFNHPVFGHLKLNKTLKFLNIHTNHHLKIIKDIVNAKN